MLKVFDRMTGEYGFHVLNASRSVRSVAADLRKAVMRVLDETGSTAEDNVSVIQPRRDKAAAKAGATLLDLNKKALP
jgi:hypothetical protein